MKTQLSYREIKFLLEKIRDDLKNNYVDLYNYKHETGKVPRDLLIENDILEDVLEKLVVAKVKCELKFKNLAKDDKKKKKLH